MSRTRFQLLARFIRFENVAYVTEEQRKGNRAAPIEWLWSKFVGHLPKMYTAGEKILKY